MARFLFFSSCSHPWGGSEELWGAAAMRLAGSGHAVAVLKTAVDPGHPRIARLRAAGCDVRDLQQFCLPPSVRLPRQLVAVAARPRAQRAAAPLVRAYLASLKPDLAVVSQGVNFDGILYADVCRAAGVPYVIVSQKASEHIWPPDSERSVMRIVFPAARRCCFVSHHNLRLTESQVGEKFANAEVVRNPFLVSGAALPWPPPQPTARLACVARLETGEKGQDILLDVLARPRWRERDLSISFFGSGVNEAALRGIASRLQTGQVTFAGFASDVESIWQTHHALVLPSRAEGLPLALVEAMMCGRFGVVTDAGGSAEVVEDGRTGFVARAATAAEVDAAMERAWAARERWPALGDAARAAIRMLVPDDPAAAFTARLLQLVGSPSPVSPASAV